MIRVEFKYKDLTYQVEYNLERYIDMDMKGVSTRYNPIAHTIVVRTYDGKWIEVDWTDELVQAARLAIYEQLAHAIITDDKPFISTK